MNHSDRSRLQTEKCSLTNMNVFTGWPTVMYIMKQMLWTLSRKRLQSHYPVQKLKDTEKLLPGCAGS